MELGFFRLVDSNRFPWRWCLLPASLCHIDSFLMLPSRRRLFGEEYNLLDSEEHPGVVEDIREFNVHIVVPKEDRRADSSCEITSILSTVALKRVSKRSMADMMHERCCVGRDEEMGIHAKSGDAVIRARASCRKTNLTSRLYSLSIFTLSWYCSFVLCDTRQMPRRPLLPGLRRFWIHSRTSRLSPE